MGDIKITYETLFELLRSEKNREPLQKVDDQFYENLVEYLIEKIKILNNPSDKTDLFSITEKTKTEKQINNVMSILKELYERREKKIINIALNKSRTNSDLIDVSNMLNEEKNLFEILVNILSNCREGILSNLLKGKVPDIKIKCDTNNNIIQIDRNKGQTIEPENSQENKQENTQISEDKQENKQEDKQDSTQENVQDMIKVRFLDQVPKFVGKELEVYGPFEDKDEADLPADIANLLVEKGRAESIDS
ncbi:hypothetical protein ACFL1H_05960 [Nanoarchaeota archaeon]